MALWKRKVTWNKAGRMCFSSLHALTEDHIGTVNEGITALGEPPIEQKMFFLASIAVSMVQMDRLCHPNHAEKMRADINNGVRLLQRKAFDEEPQVRDGLCWYQALVLSFERSWKTPEGELLPPDAVARYLCRLSQPINSKREPSLVALQVVGSYITVMATWWGDYLEEHRIVDG
jgi:hypothetical protein